MTIRRQVKKTKPLRSVLLLSFIVTCSLPSYADNKTSRQSTNHQQQELKKNNMKKILIIGMDPHTIDFTNPELPPGLTVEAIEKGTNTTLEKLNAMGYTAELFLVETGATDLNNLAKQLTEKNYDGAVIGNGIRGLKVNFILFEQIINVVHANAPKSKIIFNSLPTDTDVAVKRWL
jgi:hypothetical protein